MPSFPSGPPSGRPFRAAVAQGDELHMTAKVEQFREEVNFAAYKSQLMTDDNHVRS